MRRHKRHAGKESVELNVTAMLDMAFQLLAFFILTFKPDPVEGQIALKLPPPEAIAVKVGAVKSGDKSSDQPVGVESLIINVFATPGGSIDSMQVGEASTPNVESLNVHLRTILQDKDVNFQQVVIQVGSQLKYSELMKVVDVCTRQTLSNGEKLTKLSFVELADGK